MKRVIIAALLLLTAAACCVLELTYVGSTADKWTRRIEELDSTVRKKEIAAALRQSHDMESQWNTDAKRIDMLLIHDYIDAIGINLSQMRAYLENDSPDMYFAHSESVKKGLASIKGSEYPFLENIL